MLEIYKRKKEQINLTVNSKTKNKKYPKISKLNYHLLEAVVILHLIIRHLNLRIPQKTKVQLATQILHRLTILVPTVKVTQT